MQDRGFEVVSKYADKGVQLPTRATTNSSGFDFYAVEDVTIPPSIIGIINHGVVEVSFKKPVIVSTGIKAFMQADEELLLDIRSSIGIKHQLMIANIIPKIDSDYYNNAENEGEIFLALYNLSAQPVVIPKGARIVQGSFYKYLTDNVSVEIVREGGIGNTGV